MTKVTRETLRVYAGRMARPFNDVVREYRALSKTQQGQVLTEMRKVEAEFLVKQRQLEEKATARVNRPRPIRRVAKAIGAALATLARPR